MPFYYCSCYYTNNIYIRTYNIHFNYIDNEQFFKDYNQVLNSLSLNVTEKKLLIEEINAEVSRRRDVPKRTAERRNHIKCFYIPIDSSVYVLKEEFFDPHFLKLVNSNSEEIFQIAEQLSEEKRLFSFPVFTSGFCQKLLKEIQNFEESDMPKERPNTMNYNGVLLDELGFHDGFSLILRTKYLDPLAKILFPEWRGQGLDSHKIFTVGYKLGQDTNLDYHYDNSEITLNVCLGKSFEGGDLYFGDMKTTPINESTCILVPHKIGHGILHRGQQYHGALKITSGERQNLIMWMRSSSIRNKLCPMCNSKPSLNQSTDYGDGFTKGKEVNGCTSM